MLTKRSRVSLAARLFGVVLVCSLFVAGWAQPASANTIYTYTGNPFNVHLGSYSCTAGLGECSITGSFTLTQALPANLNAITTITPMTFSFTDGVNVWSPKNTTLGPIISFLLGSTDASGNITSWDITLSQCPTPFACPWMETGNINLPPIDIANNGALAGVTQAYVVNLPGTWSMTTTTAITPEPGSFLFLSSGLLALAGCLRRKRST